MTTWKTYLIWLLFIPYNLLLLFSPLFILVFVFKFTSFYSNILGMILGIMMLLFNGLTPKFDKEK